MQGLGALKFGLNKSPLNLIAPVPASQNIVQMSAIKAAGPTGTFALTLGFTGPAAGLETTVNFRQKEGIPVLTINWGTGPIDTVYQGYQNSWDSGVEDFPCGTTVTIRGNNTIEGLSIGSKLGNGGTGDTRLISITGTYPTALNQLIVRFNDTNPSWTIPPTLPDLSFDGKIGPVSLTTTANLRELRGPPPNLTTLNLLPSRFITAIPELPPSLVSLTTPPGLTGIPGSLTGLPRLANIDATGSTGLTSANLSGLTGLTSLPAFPTSLTSLTTPPRLTSLPNLTALNRLTSLDLSPSAQITSLSGLPPSLTTLKTPPRITSIPSLTGLPRLTSLDLSGSTGLTSINLSGLTGLTSLNLSGLTELTSLPALPTSLTSLTTPRSLTSLTGLGSLPRLTSLDLSGSTGLRVVDLSGLTSLTTLPNLPFSITSLTTPPKITSVAALSGNFTQLTTLNVVGSTGIRSLDLSALTGLTSLPTFPPFLTSLTTPRNITTTGALPRSITTLDLSNSTQLTTVNLGDLVGLTAMPQLPSSVVALTTPPNITSTGTLPPSIRSLGLGSSTKLTSLSLAGNTGITSVSLPSSLVSLDITKCTALTDISPLPAKLASLKIDGSGLRRIDLTGTSVTTLNIPPSMYPQLTFVKLSGAKLNLSGLLGVEIPSGANWTLY